MTMRSTNATESMICEPPNPRLMTLYSWKSSASVFHCRMLELPMNSTAPCGGGLVLSAASNALISDSHCDESGLFCARNVWPARPAPAVSAMTKSAVCFGELIVLNMELPWPKTGPIESGFAPFHFSFLIFALSPCCPHGSAFRRRNPPRRATCAGRGRRQRRHHHARDHSCHCHCESRDARARPVGGGRVAAGGGCFPGACFRHSDNSRVHRRRPDKGRPISAANFRFSPGDSHR